MPQSFGGQFEADKLTGRLGDNYAFLTNGFKRYCCAIDIHSPIDALTRVITAHNLGAHDIPEIVVPMAHTVALHSGAIGPEPRDITGIQLSQHFSLALTVCKRSNNFPTYMDALRSGFKDPNVLAVARKVSIAEFPDPPGSDQSPVPGQVKSAPLTVKTTNGKTYAEDLRPSKGSPQNPMTDEELEKKFMDLVTTVMPQKQASNIAATVRNLEEVQDSRDLTSLLISPSCPCLRVALPRLFKVFGSSAYHSLTKDSRTCEQSGIVLEPRRPQVRGLDGPYTHGARLGPHGPAREHLQAGPVWVRRVLCEAAQTAKRHPDFAPAYEGIARRRGKKIATTAIARKLLTRACHLLTDAASDGEHS